MKKCAIYARVSTSDQRVDNQLFDLRLFAQQRGFEVVAEFTLSLIHIFSPVSGCNAYSPATR